MTAADRGVAVIGTGIMGSRIARRLADSGRRVVAWNRDPAKVQRLEQHGVARALTPAAALGQCDVAIVMLSSGPVIDDVLFSPDHDGDFAANALRPGAIVVVMSSIPVETSRAQAARLARRDVRYVDAPVSGGEAGAREGTLTIMAGGDASVVAAVAPVLAPLGRLTRIGQVGSGQLAKLANQIIVGAGVAAVAEALAFARAGGADPGAVREALIGGFADSRLLREHGRRMVLGDFVPGGSADHQLKDLRTAQAYAEGLRLELPLLAAASELFEAMVRSGDGALDHAGVIREIERQRTSGEARPACPHPN
jgi:3-hydroxyisobutyrate dehydrogenase-like beta-hydroxyacid dehydrogenase